MDKGSPFFPKKRVTVGYDSTSFCNILTTGLQCAWTLLGNSLLWRMFSELSVCSQSCYVCVCLYADHGNFNLCTFFFSLFSVYVIVCRIAFQSICTYDCVCVCMHQICRMHVLFMTFLMCVGKQAEKPKPNRAVHWLLSTGRPQPVPDRKLRGLGSKLHLVREENAAFVSRSVCSACVRRQPVCCRV